MPQRSFSMPDDEEPNPLSPPHPLSAQVPAPNVQPAAPEPARLADAPPALEPIPAVQLPEGAALGGWEQFKTILYKNWLLKTRSLDDLTLQLVVPFIILVGVSFLTYAGDSGSYGASSYYPSSVRDGSADVFVADRSWDMLNLFNDRIDGDNNHIGRVLFAPNNANDPGLLTVASDLCNGIMTTFYNEVTAAASGYSDITVSMTPGSDCGNLVYQDAAALDSAAIGYGDGDQPILGGVVIQQYEGADKVRYAFYLNRTLTKHLNDDGSDRHAFFPSAVNIMYSGQGVLALQKHVDQYFIKTASAEVGLTLEPYFKAFPFDGWKYETFTYYFLNSFFPLIIGFSLILFLKVLVSDVVTEKQERIREGLQMMGLSPSIFWISWIVTYLIIAITFCVLCSCAVYILIFRYTNFFLFFSFLLLFTFSIVALGLLMSTLFTDAGIASLTSVFVLLAGVFTPAALTVLSKPLRLGLSIFSPFCFYWGMSVFALYEYFCFLPSFWCREESNYTEFVPEQGDLQSDVEPVSDSLRSQLALRINGLTKVFYSNGIQKVAVNNFCLDVYRGQITALLGHNGAGKTTTFNMLSGLIQPTNGDASLYGMSILSNMQRVRRVLGTCPQHNVLWDNLTVSEHLMLFGALKGVPLDTLEEQVAAVIRQVGLEGKADQQSCTLSGGMKRKLSIGIAVIGDSHLIFLDEPTSGMDPFSRRKTWAVIRGLLSSRPVVILTTHFMDEADILGDRIAIMSHGELRCCGSSLYLKRKFGLGYNLTLSAMAQNENDWNALHKIVYEHVPSSKLLSSAGNELSFQLPLTAVSQFSTLFRELNKVQHATDSSLDAWGVSITTLEEVFLTLAKEQAPKDEPDAPPALEPIPAVHDRASKLGSREPMGTCERFCSHTKILVRKRYYCIVRDAVNWVLIVVVPVLFVLVAVLAVLYGYFDDVSGFSLNAGQYNSPLYLPYTGAAVPTSAAAWTTISGSSTTVVPVSVVASGQATGQFTCASYNSEIEDHMGFRRRPDDLRIVYVQGMSTFGTTQLPVSNPSTATPFYTGDCANTDISGVDNYLQNTVNTYKQSRYGALVMNTISATANQYLIFGNGTAYHSWPTYANMANQIVLQDRMASTASYIQVQIQPLSETNDEKADAERANGVTLIYFLILGFSIVPAVFIYSVVVEDVTKAKHLQLISGIQPIAYWFSMFVLDFLCYLVSTCCIIILFLAFDIEAFYKRESFPCVLTICLLYGLSAIPQTYLFSFVFSDQNKALLWSIALYAAFGFVFFFTSFILDRLGENTQKVNDKLQYFFMLFPQYCFAMGLYKLWEDYWSQGSNADPWHYDVAGAKLIFMGWEVVFFSVMVIFAQYLSTNKSGPRGHGEVEAAPPDMDSDVTDEAALIDNNSIDPASCPIIVRHLRKLYWPFNKVRPTVAVKDLSFHVPDSEVFGFLGINGAGKTSSLAILTGEFLPTSGGATLCGLDMFHNRDEINRQIGYCPQFDALFEHLTGREHLELYARLKGVPSEQDAAIAYLLDVMGLGDAADRKAGGYSGGNKRKLSVAIALIGSPRLVFLDEPSTGMDPEARRFMWRVISSTMQGRSVILTTHSMEEAEALSHRIGIMVNGRFKCLGNKQHLKEKYGQGYTIEVSIESGQEKASDLEKWFETQMPQAVLLEAQDGHYSYQQKENLELASLFEQIEQSQTDLGIVSFSISQTTLEQVFNKFAADQAEEQHSDINASSLSNTLKHFWPSVSSICGCCPIQQYRWVLTDHKGNPIQVAVTFEHGACICCKSNPGIVTVNGEPVNALNSNDEQLLLSGSVGPGCRDACCGCISCCGCSSCFCCTESRNEFLAHGRHCEIVTYNEIQGSERARPCLLVVDGVEVDSGVKRNLYLDMLFWRASCKSCCVFGLPTFIIMMALMFLGREYRGLYVLALIALGCLVYCCIWCIVGNYCRSSHYTRTAEPEFSPCPTSPSIELKTLNPQSDHWV